MRDSLEDVQIVHEKIRIETVINDEILNTGLTSDDFLELGVAIEGGGVHCFEGKIIPCKAGDIYLVRGGVPHGYFLTDPQGQLLIRRLAFPVKDWFRGDFAATGGKRFCYGAFEDGSDVSYAMLNSMMRELVLGIMDQISEELLLRDDEWRSVTRAYLIQLFTFIARYINRSEKNAPRRAGDSETVAAVVNMIGEEFSDNALSLEGIASRLYVSPSSLSRMFKAQTGQLFSDYVKDVRLRYAAGLLSEKDATVESVIKKSGFRDVSSFYRNFRAAFGVTPQAYKEITIPSERSDEIKIKKEERKMEILKEISTNVQNGKAKIVKELVQGAIDAGAVPEEILNEGLLAGMSVIGEKFKNNEIYVPEVLVAARAMSMGAQILKPYLVENGVEAVGKVCIGTVQGDLHDIGKNLVKMMMEGKGLEVVDLGTDVSPEAFVKAAKDEGCQIICCSALLTTTMPVMEEVVKAAEAAGIRDKVKIMIGGAPINEEFCKKIGADCYTVDAASAADAAVGFCKA